MESGFGSFKGFGEPAQDLSSSDGLLALAQAQGGAVSQVATELAHPKTGILSSVSKGFKNAFSDFIDIISVPNQLVAGAISSKYTMKEAVQKNISTSDVLYGKADPKASIYQKIGSFTVRLATDVLLDPTTYLTFGTGAILKTGAKSTVVLNDIAAAHLGKEAFETIALNPEGRKALQYVSNLGRQMDGTAAYTNIKAGNAFFDLAEEELKTTLKKTVDAPLDQDFARDVMTRVFERNPALVKDYMDKGGIKYFGQTILSAQRMKSTFEMIPGMNSLDVITEQPRKALAALFDPAYRKTAEGKWVRTPQGIVEMEQKWKDLTLARTDRKMRALDDVVKEFGLDPTGTKIVMANLQAGSIPADAKLAGALKALLDFSDEEFDDLVKSGNMSAVSKIERHVPQILVDPGVKSVAIGTSKSLNAGAVKERSMAKFVNSQTGEAITGHKDMLGLKRVLTEEEQANIVRKITETTEKTGSKVEVLEKEIETLAGVIQDVFSGKVSDATKEILRKSKNIDKKNLKTFVQSIVNEAGELNVGKLVKSYGVKNYEAGVKKSIQQAVNDLSPEALEVLVKQVAKAKKALPEDLAHLNDALAAAIKKAPKKTAKAGAEVNTAGEIKDMMKKVKLADESGRAAKVAKGVDQESMAQFVEGIKAAFLENPQGARKAIESIIGRKQQITDLLSELDISVLGAKTGLAGLPNAPAIYKNAAGDIFTKEAAPFFNIKDAEHLQVIEETYLKDPKKAEEMLQAIKTEGFEIFDDNLVTALAARSLQNVKTITMQDMVKDFARTFGVDAEYANESFVRLSGESMLRVASASGDMKFHPAIASFLEDFAKSVKTDDATMGFLKSYDTLQNFWKASVTAVWPAFHGRNAISNVLQNYLDIGLSALDPRTHVMSSQLIVAQRSIAKLQREVVGGSTQAQEKIAELLTKNFFTDVTGHTWSYGEMIQVAKNNNIAFTSRIVSQSDAAGGPEGLMAALMPAKTKLAKAGRIAATPGRIGQDVVGRTIEEQSRLVNFITNLKASGDVTMASRQTKQFLFDYSNLTNFERNVMKRILPFYTFTRKNLELQARAIINTPGRIAAEVHGFETLGEVISGGEQLTDAERDKLPDWAKSGMTVLTKKNGNQVNILRNLGTPLEAPFQQIQANNMLGSVSPVVRIPVELGAGYNFFAGKPLSEVTNASAFVHAPKVLKDMIGFTTVTKADGSKLNVAMRPEMMHLILNLPPTPRVWSTLAGLENQELSVQEKTIANLIGVKAYSFDLELEQAKKENILRKQLEDLLTEAGITAKFTRTFIPKTEAEKAAKETSF
jgi:hypothetical protein